MYITCVETDMKFDISLISRIVLSIAALVYENIGKPLSILFYNNIAQNRRRFKELCENIRATKGFHRTNKNK